MSAVLPPVDSSIKAVPESHMKLLSHFAATWGQPLGPNFGIHCARCGQDVQAQNGQFDTVLSVRCGCREYRSDRWSLG